MRNGGHVVLDSPPGLGAIVILVLPVAPWQRGYHGAAAARSAPAGGRRGRDLNDTAGEVTP